MAVKKTYIKNLQSGNKSSYNIILPKIFLIILGIDPETDKVEISVNENSDTILIKKVEDEKNG